MDNQQSGQTPPAPTDQPAGGMPTPPAGGATPPAGEPTPPMEPTPTPTPGEQGQGGNQPGGTPTV